MEKTTLYLPSQLQQDLRALARRTGRPQAALIREALERYVSGHERAWPASIGSASDGTLDAAESEAWLRQHWETPERKLTPPRRATARRPRATTQPP